MVYNIMYEIKITNTKRSVGSGRERGGTLTFEVLPSFITFKIRNNIRVVVLDTDNTSRTLHHT